MPSPITLNAPAKINLFLNVLGLQEEVPYQDCSTILHRQSDEELTASQELTTVTFHELSTIFLALSLSDTLTVELLPDVPGPHIEFTCSDPALCTSNNLVVDAYHVFYRQVIFAPLAVRVHLDKHIPVQAGLGGGSSDAAAMLKALNKLHENAISRMALQAMGASLGSDVPFFLSTTPLAHATGRGDILRPLPAIPPISVVLLKPSFGVSTKAAYEWLDSADEYGEMPINPLISLLSRSPFDVTAITSHLYNDFEAVIFPRYPQLDEAQWTLQEELGLLSVHLSGSGPTLFGITPPDWDDTRKTQCLTTLQQRYPSPDWDVFITESASPPAFLAV